MKKPQVILDSGAYTMHRRGLPINIEEYATFVKEHGKNYVGHFNLDVIGNAEESYKNWQKLRKLGVDTIPVFHIGTDEKWLVRYMKETDYIALGAIANLDIKQRIYSLDRIWRDYLVDSKGFPKLKVHGLGLTAIPIMLRFPWYSVDSFTPVISAVWGSILLPRLDNSGHPYYFDTFLCKVSDQSIYKKGVHGNYLNLPKRSQVFYEQLFESHDVLLGQITYQERRPRRGKNDEIARKPKPVLDLTFPSDPTIMTMANHWGERMRWNLEAWAELQKRLPKYPRTIKGAGYNPKERINSHEKTKIYLGVSTNTHMEIYMSKVSTKLDILISYAYLNETIAALISKYIQ